MKRYPNNQMPAGYIVYTYKFNPRKKGKKKKGKKDQIMQTTSSIQAM